MESQSFEKYYRSVREDVLQLVQGSNHRTLDIGCGAGETSAEMLKRGISSHAVGVEPDPAAARLASSSLSKLYNCTDSEIPWSEMGRFDVVILADVLEHLYSPDVLLTKLHQVITRSTQIIVSVPNARCFLFWAPLIFKDEFTYRDSGIMDRTHIRWFTKTSLTALINDCGYTIEQQGKRYFADAKPQPLRGLFNMLGSFAITQNLVSIRAKQPLRE